jgi:hypothetical protein
MHIHTVLYKLTVVSKQPISSQNVLFQRWSIVTGIPELDLVPLDPMVIPRLEFKEGSGNFRFSQVMTNVTIHGLGAFKLQSVK